MKKTGFIIQVLLLFSFLSCNNNHSKVENCKYVYSVIQLHKLKFVLFESSIYGRKWIVNGKMEKAEFKEDLIRIRNKEIPDILSKIGTYKSSWSEEEKKQYALLRTQIDSILLYQDSIMNNLKSFQDYENPSKYFGTLPLAEKLKQKSEFVRENLDLFLTEFERKIN